MKHPLKRIQGTILQNPILNEFGDEVVDDEFIVSPWLGEKEECTSGVYVVRCGEYYKIGSSVDINRRLNDFRISNPYDIELVIAIVSDFGIELESQLQNHFKNKKHRGEWYKLTDDDLLEICGLMENTWRILLNQQKNKD